MPFPYDRYPWLNFQELNLAYFIKHFREIFEQWDQLYHDLLDWKEATDEDLAEWKSATETGLESWKIGLTASLETWKSQTASDISGWESATLAALDAWKTTTTAVFEEIRVQAAGSASAAAASAANAETARAAAASAQAAAEQAAETLVNSVSWHSNEIDLLSMAGFTTGYLLNPNGIRSASTYFEYSGAIAVKPHDVITFAARNPGTGTSIARVIGYDTSDEPPISGSGVTPNAVELYAHPNTVEEYSAEIYIPEGINYIRASVRITEENLLMRRNGSAAKFNISGIRPEHVSPLRSYAGKRLSILGASISTFEDEIPEGYSTYYPRDPATVTGQYPVTQVEDTYWSKVARASGMSILVNNSSAGSYVSTYGGATMAGCGDRCTQLHTAAADPDVIIIQLGGNDFTRQVEFSDLWDGDLAPIPSYSALELDKFNTAYAAMLDKITTRYPAAIVCCGLIPVISGSAYVQNKPPCINLANTALRVYNNAIRKAAQLFNCKIIDWESCGLTFYNASLYMQDYGQHPNKYGHSLMAYAVLECLGIPHEYIENFTD